MTLDGIPLSTIPNRFVNPKNVTIALVMMPAAMICDSVIEGVAKATAAMLFMGCTHIGT
jgi:hypothetical protein